MGLMDGFVGKIVYGLSHMTCTISVSGVKLVESLGVH